MDVYEAVRTRLTVREFKPDPVPDEVVQKMLRAVQWAPSSRNRQPWHLVVVRDKDMLRKIGSIASSGRFVADAPMAIAVAMENADRPDLDTGRAVQQMELVAWEEGLGTCFVGLRLAEQNRQIKELLGIPESFDLVTVLPFGYRLVESQGRQGMKNRKSMDDIVHWEQYGGEESAVTSSEQSTIRTVAGTGEAGHTGDGGPAESAAMSEPFMCVFDADGNLFVCEVGTHVVRKIDAVSGIVSTVAGQRRVGIHRRRRPGHRSDPERTVLTGRRFGRQHLHSG